MYKTLYDLRTYKNTLKTNHAWKNGVEYKDEIPGYYSNELLSKIIDDTYDFIREIIMNNENNEYTIALSEERPIEHICLDTNECISCDIIYIDRNGRLLSKAIMMDAFFIGTRIMKGQTKISLIEVSAREKLFELKLSNLPENTADLEELFGKPKTLKQKEGK